MDGGCIEMLSNNVMDRAELEFLRELYRYGFSQVSAFGLKATFANLFFRPKADISVDCSIDPR